jgi:hypothetical protein
MNYNFSGESGTWGLPTSRIIEWLDPAMTFGTERSRLKDANGTCETWIDVESRNAGNGRRSGH